MRVTLIILCFLLLLQKSNTQVSSVHPVRANALKAFVLERKKTEVQVQSSHPDEGHINDGLNTTTQVLHWDLEADDDNSLSDSNKVKLLCSFCLILPSLFLLFSERVREVFRVIPAFFGELSYRYILQCALRI